MSHGIVRNGIGCRSRFDGSGGGSALREVGRRHNGSVAQILVHDNVDGADAGSGADGMTFHAKRKIR